MRQQIYLVPILLLAVSTLQVYGVPVGGGVPHRALARQLGSQVKILHVHLGKFIEVNDDGTVSATVHAGTTGSSADFEVEVGAPASFALTFKFRSKKLTGQYLGLTEDNHIRVVDSSDQTAITEFIWEDQQFLRANKGGASCYIAFETSDTETATYRMAVDNPCEIDPHVDQDKALINLLFF